MAHVSVNQSRLSVAQLKVLDHTYICTLCSRPQVLNGVFYSFRQVPLMATRQANSPA